MIIWNNEFAEKWIQFDLIPTFLLNFQSHFIINTI